MVKLKLSTIKEGRSSFEIEAATADVELQDNEQFSHPIRLSFDCNKIGDEIFVALKTNTVVDLICDVCLEPFSMKLNESVDILLAKDQELVEREEDDVYLIPDSTNEIDITDSIKQTLLLAIPLKKVCRSGCKGLCPICGANLNENPCACERKKTDPRWDALKGIKFDKE